MKSQISYYFLVLLAVSSLSVFLVLSSCNSEQNEAGKIQDVEISSSKTVSSGAVLKALSHPVPPDFSLRVNGIVAKEYTFSGSDLEALVKRRMKGVEVDSKSKYQGAYLYYGIPLRYIVESIEIQKPDFLSYPKPEDMLISLASATGELVHFSYGEVMLTDDIKPVMLAYYQEDIGKRKTEIYPSENYLDGLRVISPRDKDNGRYLSDIVSITLKVPEVPIEILPKFDSENKGRSWKIMTIRNSSISEGSFKGVGWRRIKNWYRLGREDGFEGTFSASGFKLTDYIQKNFRKVGKSNAFMFIGRNGKRTLVTGYEIFNTDLGQEMYILNRLNGSRPQGGLMLSSINDFYSDRDIRALSHIVMLDQL